MCTSIFLANFNLFFFIVFLIIRFFYLDSSVKFPFFFF